MSRLFAVLLLLAVLSTWPVHAQVASDIWRPMFATGYATATTARPEQGKGSQLGGSGGLIFEHSRYLAIDFRGVMLQARVPLHTYIVEVGPRVTPHFNRHWQPYAGLLAGYGHTGYRVAKRDILSKGFGLAWTANFGLDLGLKYGLDWRVAEYSYSQIFAGSGASPTMLSTGVIYHFNARGVNGRTM